MIDKEKNHKFVQGSRGCLVCGRKWSHLIHKQPKASYYNVGEGVGRYVVGARGEFRRVGD